MASTSVALGPHWEDFLRAEIESGRYKNNFEVVRTGLRELEERREQLRALCEHLVTVYEQAQDGELVDDACCAR